MVSLTEVSSIEGIKCTEKKITASVTICYIMAELRKVTKIGNLAGDHDPLMIVKLACTMRASACEYHSMEQDPWSSPGLHAIL